MASCNCNHKSRKDEFNCCCDCHGKSNSKKSCQNKKPAEPAGQEELDQESYVKRS